MRTETTAPAETPPKPKRLKPRPKPPRRVTLDTVPLPDAARAMMETRAGYRFPPKTRRPPRGKEARDE